MNLSKIKLDLQLLTNLTNSYKKWTWFMFQPMNFFDILEDLVFVQDKQSMTFSQFKDLCRTKSEASPSF